MPNYLAPPPTGQQYDFEKIVQQQGAVDIEPLRQIACLVHHCTVLELEQSLWSSYLHCGTGRYKPNGSDVLFWPAQVRIKMHTMQQCATNSDAATCSQFVRQHLHTLTDQQHEYRRQLNQRSGLVEDFARSFEQPIQAFVQQSLARVRSKYEYKTKLVAFDYDQYALECQFRQQATNDLQVCQTLSAA